VKEIKEERENELRILCGQVYVVLGVVSSEINDIFILY
jgi:hypothetical protein